MTMKVSDKCASHVWYCLKHIRTKVLTGRALDQHEQAEWDLFKRWANTQTVRDLFDAEKSGV